MTISTIPQKVSRELALRRLAPVGVRRWINGPLRGIAEIYLPYRLYRVTVEDRGQRRSWFYGIDAASGALDPYEFDKAPELHEQEVEPRNCYPVRIGENETRSLAIEKVRRIFFSRGFFRLADPQITAELINFEFHLPYWIGFYGGEQNVNFTVLNGARETVEGAKIRRLLYAWLTEAPAESLDPGDVRVKNSI